MSITYELFDETIIYPPTPGDKGGPCLDERCGHFDCYRMRKDAAALCPTCQQPAGYSNIMRMKPIFSGYAADRKDTGFRTVTDEHEACYQARLERERADAEAQTDALMAATKADAEAARVNEEM